MEKIEKYIEKFFKKHKKNVRYDIHSDEMLLFGEMVNIEEPYPTIRKIFNYGYVKGYKAAMAEMEKGGAQ